MVVTKKAIVAFARTRVPRSTPPLLNDMTKALAVLDSLAFERIYGADGRAAVARRTALLAEPLTREAAQGRPGAAARGRGDFFPAGARP